MKPDQFEQLQRNIESTIKSTVNGKIDKLQASLDATNVRIDTYIREDNEWKEKYSPYLESIVGVSVGGKILMKFILGIAAVGGAILIIYHWFK